MDSTYLVYLNEFNAYQKNLTKSLNSAHLANLTKYIC